MNNEELIIRDYRDEDFPEVDQLWSDTGMGSAARGDDGETIRRTLAQGGRLLVLESKTTAEIIGTSWLTQDGRRIYIHHFGIAQEHQGNGNSWPLLKASLDHARSTGMQIKLEVQRDNHKAVNLYRKAGFKYLGDYDVYIIRDYKDLD